MWIYRILLLLNIFCLSCANTSKAKLEKSYRSLFFKEQEFPEKIFPISRQSDFVILNNFEALAERFRHKEKEQFRLSLSNYTNAKNSIYTIKDLASKYGAVYHSNTFNGLKVDVKSYKKFVIKNKIPKSQMAIKGWEMPIE